MGFIENMKRGYEITVTSLQIVCKDSWMILLPIITGILLIAILTGFVLLPGTADERLGDPLTYLFIIAYFFFVYFCFYFVQAMIISSAAITFAGKKSSVGQAFSASLPHIGKILFFSILAAIVGLISSVLSSDKNGVAGKVAGGLIGFGWTIASYFSMPIILQEKTGVLDSFKRSWDVLNKCWGEVAGGNISLLLFFIPGFLFLIIGGILVNVWIIAFGLVLLFVAMIIMNPVNAVLSEALYFYATKGKVPTGFTEEQLEGFFVKTNKKKNLGY